MFPAFTFIYKKKISKKIGQKALQSIHLKTGKIFHLQTTG